MRCNLLHLLGPAIPSTSPTPTSTSHSLFAHAPTTTSTCLPTDYFTTIQLVLIPGQTNSILTIPAKTIVLARPICVQTLQPYSFAYMTLGRIGPLLPPLTLHPRHPSYDPRRALCRPRRRLLHRAAHRRQHRGSGIALGGAITRSARGNGRYWAAGVIHCGHRRTIRCLSTSRTPKLGLKHGHG